MCPAGRLRFCWLPHADHDGTTAQIPHPPSLFARGWTTTLRVYITPTRPVPCPFEARPSTGPWSLAGVCARPAWKSAMEAAFLLLGHTQRDLRPVL